MGIKVKIEIQPSINEFERLEDIHDRLVKEAAEFFIKTTPIRTGNARSRTYLGGNVIRAEYPYAQRLDQGYSRQAPQGMIQPTLDFIDKRLKQLVEKK